LNKIDYITKIEDMQHDQDTYININKNFVNKLINFSRTLLTRWTIILFVMYYN